MGQRKKVKEIIAVWDKETEKVEWKEFKVKPNEVNKDDLMAKTVDELVQIWFPEDSPYRKRPQGATDLDWSNHLNSLIGMICEIK